MAGACSYWRRSCGQYADDPAKPCWGCWMPQADHKDGEHVAPASPPHTGGAPSQLDAAALREAGRVAGIAEALSACARQYDGFVGGENHPINQGVILCMKAIRALQPTTPDPTPSSGGGET